MNFFPESRVPAAAGLTVMMLFLPFLCPLGASDWYSSNSAGIPGRLLSADAPSAEGWSLSVTRKEKQEIHSLYKNGTLNKSFHFFRDGGLLTEKEERDASGQLVSRVEYVYDSQGNPRAVFIQPNPEKDEETAVLASQPESAGSSSRNFIDGGGADWLITRQNNQYKPLKQLRLENGETASETEWKRDSEGRLYEQLVSNGNETTRSLYDSEGRLKEEQIVQSRMTVSRRLYFWQENELVRVEERGTGYNKVRNIVWADGRMIRETFIRDGLRVRENEWKTPGEKVETFFRDDMPVIRIYWKDSVKLREEFLSQGQVVRTRERKSPENVPDGIRPEEYAAPEPELESKL